MLMLDFGGLGNFGVAGFSSMVWSGFGSVVACCDWFGVSICVFLLVCLRLFGVVDVLDVVSVVVLGFWAIGLYSLGCCVFVV